MGNSPVKTGSSFWHLWTHTPFSPSPPRSRWRVLGGKSRRPPWSRAAQPFPWGPVSLPPGPEITGGDLPPAFLLMLPVLHKLPQLGEETPGQPQSLSSAPDLNQRCCGQCPGMAAQRPPDACGPLCAGWPAPPGSRTHGAQGAPRAGPECRSGHEEAQRWMGCAERRGGERLTALPPHLLGSAPPLTPG